MGGAVTIDRETESSSTEGLSGFSRGVVIALTPASGVPHVPGGAGGPPRELVSRLIEYK